MLRTDHCPLPSNAPFLAKPFDPNALLGMLRRTLDGPTPQEPDCTQ